MRAVERAADGQQRVADRLGLEPPDGSSASSSRFSGIDLRRLRVVVAALIW